MGPDFHFLTYPATYQFYGVPPGGESLEEGRLRMAREKEERERRLQEIEE